MRYCELDFKENLKEIMEAKQITQSDLADMIDSYPATVSLFCSGKTIPTLFTICLICDALGTDPNTLLKARR